jgi:ATP-dependent exoDNAse (exonuclease V) beta subunit
MKLKFNESKHEYSLGKRKLPSVTDVISHFFEPFDKDYWAEYKADQRRVSKDTILEEWREKRDWGSKVHSLIEGHIKGESRKNHSNEVEEAINFLKSTPHSKIESELRVYSPEWMIAGTIDVAMETPEGIMLFDWKTTSNLRMENSFRQCNRPISHLDDCNYSKFILQLNFYKALYEQSYGKKVVGMGFILLSDSEPYKYFHVDDHSEEVNSMIEHLIKPFPNQTWIGRVLDKIKP